jgi:hypothetical protein
MTPRPGTQDALLIQVLDGLLAQYLDKVPDANRVVSLITDRGDRIQNDHIAFRSIDITSILTIFLGLGYSVHMNPDTKKPFNFDKKKLTAVWLKHPNPDAPRVFVSQFRFDDGSPELQTIVQRYLGNWQDPIADVDMTSAQSITGYLQTAHWPTPTYADYCALQQESEYVAWVLVNKYYLNHFTLSVHGLASFNFETELNRVISDYHISYTRHQSDTILDDAAAMMARKYYKNFEEFNHYLQDANFTMNQVGASVINRSPDGLLLQSSTKAALIRVLFDEGYRDIPGSYVEFAYRGVTNDAIRRVIRSGGSMAMVTDDMRRDGFETQNADKIFESTYVGMDSHETDHQTQSSYEASCTALLAFFDNYYR